MRQKNKKKKYIINENLYLKYIECCTILNHFFFMGNLSKIAYNTIKLKFDFILKWKLI